MRSDASSLLAQCRDVLIARTGEALAALRARLLDDTAVGPDPGLRGELSSRWPGAVDTWRRALAEFYDEQVRFAARGRLGQAYDFSASTLQLIDEAELDFAIALGEARRRLRQACEGELYRLDLRFAHLLGTAEIDEEHDPLGLAAIAYALRLTIQRLGGARAVRLWLLRLLEQRLQSELPAIYADLNAFLASQDVLPKVPAVIRRREERVAPAAARSGIGALPAEQDPLARLRQAMAPRQAASGAAISEAALAALDAMLQTLTRLQRQAPAGDAAPSASADAPSLGLLQAIRAGSFGASLSGIDPATVDIVSLLFDAVFQDEEIPERVKSLLAWLQIPLLKVALADPSLFENPQHPARRVLDTLARLSCCLGPGAPEDSPVYEAVKAAVSRIRNEFDRDPSLFDQVLAQLAPFAAGSRLPGSLPPDTAAALAAQCARREQADAVVAGIVDAALRPDVPRFITTFFDTHWRELLTRVDARSGEGEEEWRCFAAVVGDLLWSIEPKVAPESRKRLVALLPDLLRRLNAGFDLLDAPTEERECFLDALVALHSVAMKAGMQPGAGAQSSPAAAANAAGALDVDLGQPLGPPSPREELVVTAQMLGEHEVLLLRLRGGPEAGRRADAAAGDCIDVHLPPGSAPRRACVCHYDNVGRVLVFAYTDARRALVLSAATLDWLIENNQARWIGREPLVERTVRRALKSVRSGSAPGSACSQ